jgi:hypothetical protein
VRCIAQGRGLKLNEYGVFHRYFTLLAHPSGRLMGSREPIDIDMLRIVREAKQRGCYARADALA